MKETKPSPKQKARKVKAWCILPLVDKVSGDGWTFYTPVFLSKKEALLHASKELVIRCEISYLQ